MTGIDLLSIVQPSVGWFAVMGIKGKKVKQKLVATREEVDTLTQYLVDNKWNVFFGVAKYASDAGRKKNNVQALKSFWLDIDCGENKAKINVNSGKPDGYIDQAAGLEALRSFCETTGLPKPLIVNSGRGLHVYWVLEQEITPKEWQPVADRLQQICTTQDFYIDKAVFEPSRVLRIPGTYNFKDDPPKPVSVVANKQPSTIPYDTFREILGVEEPSRGTLFGSTKPPESMLGKRLRENKQYSFRKIMKRGADGCGQLNSAYKERKTIEHNRWLNALTVAAGKTCIDRDMAIHRISKDHPDYDSTLVESRANSFDSETGANCLTFEKHYPAGCVGCPHKGLITHPAALGIVIAEAEEKDNIVEVTELTEEGKEETTAYEIPIPPYPFIRGKTGGLYRMPHKEADNQDPLPVYEYDIYVVKRMFISTPEEQDVMVMKVHMPQDGVKEFVIPFEALGNTVDMRKILNRAGILVPGKERFARLLEYIYTLARELQLKKRVEKMRTQFGWADNNSVFILGDREITKDGTFYSPPSSATRKLVQLMDSKGTIEKWKEVWSLYGTSGLEPHAFAALTAFGSPIFGFLGQSGAMINLYNSSSGTGKTTTLRMINSVYGHPKDLCVSPMSTVNGTIQLLGTLNNLPFVIDEITSWEAKVFSEFAYAFTIGTGKERMKSHVNELRDNTTKWACMGVCSANASFYEKLADMKAFAQAEMMRFMEYKVGFTKDVSSIPTDIGLDMFDTQLNENYGHAGGVYIDYLVNNLERVKDLQKEIQARLNKELDVQPRERFWSAQVASNFAGGIVAKHLGLLVGWDLPRIYSWAKEKVNEIRQDVAPPVENAIQVISAYLLQHIAQHCLIISGAADKRSGINPLPTLEPRGELLVRFETDTRLWFIISSPFKKFCVERQLNFKDTLEELRNLGVLAAQQNKHMTKGLQVAALSANCLVIDGSHPNFRVSETIVTQAIENANDVSGES